MTGPFASSQEAARASGWEQSGRDAGRSIRESNLLDLLSALDGTETGRWDNEVIEWLAGWEPSTVAAIAGMIRRVRQP